MANRTVDQTNIVGDTTVAGANEVSQAGVEGVENVAASTGLINQVSDLPSGVEEISTFHLCLLFMFHIYMTHLFSCSIHLYIIKCMS